jgi:protein-S-isoprenylcysteine O-methyltransferase Ste14
MWFLNALILTGMWLAYFVFHSLLASMTAKQWVASRYPSLMPYYRLSFNSLAVALLLLPVWYMFTHQSDYLWQWQGLTGWLMNGMAVVALLLFIWSLSHYDTSEFLGTRQIKQGITAVHDQETLHISPLHRFVRHPWYTLALVVLWTRSMDLMMLVSAIAITLYFKIGSLLEEKKLVAYHGKTYEQYRRQVPGLIPLPWRYLSKSQAKALLNNGAE